MVLPTHNSNNMSTWQDMYKQEERALKHQRNKLLLVVGDLTENSITANTDKEEKLD